MPLLAAGFFLPETYCRCSKIYICSLISSDWEEKVGRRRGFFAELQHQNRLAERARVREQKQAAREYNAAMREIERARKAEER